MDLIRLLNSPRLFWVYPKNAQAIGQGYAYPANGAENWGQSVLTWLKFLVNLSVYTSPFYFPWIYRRLEAARTNPRGVTDMILILSTVYTAGIILRAAGRKFNPTYVEFSRLLTKAQKDFTPANRVEMEKFDFGFEAWPVDFNSSRKSQPTFLEPPSYSLLESVTRFPQRAVGWFMINTFGFKMIFPGSVAALQYFIGPSVIEGRATLVKKGGQRYKLKAEDGNEIDSMFFDNKGKTENGNKVVIVCEGNAGFYEMGMLNVPLDQGYSVVGWNHPGFWGSTGSPFPKQDAFAVDAVMQFAKTKLGFKEEDVIVYGWSIGGVSATWLAMNYPNIHALILDATFDHLTPLAIEKMPTFLESTVRIAVRDNMDLDVSQQLSKFDGPVRFIRRSKDEMISTDDTQMTESNRGNYLLLQFLKTRFPNLFTEEQAEVELMAYLSKELPGQEQILKDRGIELGGMERYLSEYVASSGAAFPFKMGKGLDVDEKSKLVLFLASRYMSEFDSAHCTPLQQSLFKMPWAPK